MKPTVKTKRGKVVHNLKGEFVGLNDVDQMFDLVCFKNYICGDFKMKIPVDENREIFAVIKKLLTPSQRTKKRA